MIGRERWALASPALQKLNMKLSIPTQKTTWFACDDPENRADIRVISPEDAHDLGKDHSFFVTFRQHNTSDTERRGSFLGKRSFKSEGNGDFTQIVDFSGDALRRLEVQAVLSGTDLFNSAGKELKFEQSGSYPKVLSTAEFNKWWDDMPPQWAEEIHSACLEINPEWDPKRLSDME